MWKLSNKGRYAVRALSDMAFHEDGSPAQIKDIAKRQRIPLRFLEQIFQDLKRAGLARSKRGPRGGYQLAKSPAVIRVGDVLRAIEGQGAALRNAPARPPKELREVTDAVFEDLAIAVARCFEEVTIEDVCARGEEMGIRRRLRPLSAYVI
jgi:Rrf2 family protein